MVQERQLLTAHEERNDAVQNSLQIMTRERLIRRPKRVGMPWKANRTISALLSKLLPLFNS